MSRPPTPHQTQENESIHEGTSDGSVRRLILSRARKTMVWPVSERTFFGAVSRRFASAAIAKFLLRLAIDITVAPMQHGVFVFEFAASHTLFKQPHTLVGFGKLLSLLLCLLLGCFRELGLSSARRYLGAIVMFDESNILKIVFGLLRHFVDDEDGLSTRLEPIPFEFEFSMDVGRNA